MQKPASSQSSQGFTLIELLIAMMLMATIVTALFAIFTSVIDASTHARKEMGSDRAGRAVLNLLEDDFRHMKPDTTTAGLKFDANIEASSFDEEVLVGFATTSSLAFDAEKDPFSVQYVKYSLVKQKDGSKTLFRIEEQHPTLTGDFTTTRYELLSNVAGASITYYNSTYNEFQKEWGVENVTTPEAVKVKFVLGTGADTATYSLIIPLPQSS